MPLSRTCLIDSTHTHKIRVYFSKNINDNEEKKSIKTTNTKEMPLPGGGMGIAATGEESTNNNARTKEKQKKQQLWDHAWVPNGERREKVKALIKEMQKEHFRNFRKYSNHDETTYDRKLYLEEGLDVLVQWAQLGEGIQCLKAAKDLVNIVPLTKLSDYEFHVKIFRRVLHAHYNHFQRITWSHKTQKPKLKLTSREIRLGKEVLQKADTTLQRLENLSRTYVHKSKLNRQPKKTLLDASDYGPLVCGYYLVQSAVSSLSTLRRLTDLFSINNRLERLIPGPDLYLAVMKAIYNCSDQDWYDRMGDMFTTTECIDLLCCECINHVRKKFPNRQQKTSSLLPLYNIALAAWNRELPNTIAKQQPEEKGKIFELSLFTDETINEKVDRVNTEVTKLWNMLSEDGIKINSKTYLLLIDIHTKSGKLERAFFLLEPLSDYLKKRKRKKRIKGLNNLIPLLESLGNALIRNASTKQQKSEVAARIEDIIENLWDLATDAGYIEIAPSIHLYITAMNAWAEAQSSESVLRAQKLLDDLKSQQEQNFDDELLLTTKLRPNIAVYNSLLKAIAKQPEVDKRGYSEYVIDPARQATIIIEALLYDLENHIDDDDDQVIIPNIETYNAWMEACLASQNMEQMEEIWHNMITTENPPPNEETFDIMIDALLALKKNTIPPPSPSTRIETVLNQLEERFSPPHSSRIIGIYEKIVFSWCNEVGKAKRASRILERLEELYIKSRNGSDKSMMQPKRSLYNAVIQALEDHGEVSDADSTRRKRDIICKGKQPLIEREKIRSNKQVFEQLKEINIRHFDESSSNLLGNTQNFNRVISILSESGEVSAGERAEDILVYMLELTFKRKNEMTRPNLETFNGVVKAWANSHHALAGNRASEILKKLDILHGESLLENVVANYETYNSIMNAYANSPSSSSNSRDDSTTSSARKAQIYFYKLLELYEATGDSNYKPDINTYSIILYIWSRSNEESSAEQTENILNTMLSNYEEDQCNNNILPDIYHFNQVLLAHARKSNDFVAFSSAVERVLKLMQNQQKSSCVVIPDTQTYNNILLGIRRCKESISPRCVLELLVKVNELNDSFDNEIYNTAIYKTISTFAKKGDVDTAIGILDELLLHDDSFTFQNRFFSDLLNFLLEDMTSTNDITLVVERIVNTLLEKRKNGIDCYICNALINCWNYTKEGPIHSRKILQNMLDNKYGISPATSNYNAVIDSWARSGDDNAGSGAEEVLKMLLQNTATKKSGAVQEARPTMQSYISTIQAFARSNSSKINKSRKAREIIQIMKEDYAMNRAENNVKPPSLYAYNTVLIATESNTNKTHFVEDYENACATYQDIRLSTMPKMKPNDVTYASFFGIIAKLPKDKSESRGEMLDYLFHRCCIDGQLSPMVIEKFKNAFVSIEQYNEFMKKSETNEGNLPDEWTRNVVVKRRKKDGYYNE